MRRFVLSLVVLLEVGPAGYAQDQLRGVYGPPSGVPGALGGVYGFPPAAAPALPSSLPSRLPSTVSAPDYEAEGSGPAVSVAGTPQQGELLPAGVKLAPIPGRPGYGAAVVNGHRAIVDLNTHRIFQLLD
jgi:Protein of unknown function (DUF1236)